MFDYLDKDNDGKISVEEFMILDREKPTGNVAETHSLLFDSKLKGTALQGAVKKAANKFREKYFSS